MSPIRLSPAASRALDVIRRLEAELEELLGSAAITELHESLNRIVMAGRAPEEPEAG